MAALYPVRGSHQETTEYVLRILGAGAATPTKQEGLGMTVSYISTGKYKITWAEDPYQFLSAGYGLLPATIGDLKGFSVEFEAYNSTTKTMQFQLWNASQSATDLATTQRLSIVLKFARTGY